VADPQLRGQEAADLMRTTGKTIPSSRSVPVASPGEHPDHDRTTCGCLPDAYGYHSAEALAMSDLTPRGLCPSRPLRNR
jgi:hypothetical protein